MKKELLYSWTDSSLIVYVSAEIASKRVQSLTVFPTWKRGQIVPFDSNKILRTLWKRNINFEKETFELYSDQGYKMQISCCLKSVSSQDYI